MCAFNNGQRELSGSRELSGDLAVVTTETHWEPPPSASLCLGYLGATDGERYLVGISYEDATVWVAAQRDHCAGASNGEFATSTNFGGTAAEALASGRWPAATSVGCDVSGRRYGQQDSLVPDEPTSLTICTNVGSPVEVNRPELADLLAVVRSVSTESNEGFCKPIREGPRTSYVLTFRYVDGPPQTLMVNEGCVPSAWNGSLASSQSEQIVAAVRHVLNTH